MSPAKRVNHPESSTAQRQPATHTNTSEEKQHHTSSPEAHASATHEDTLANTPDQVLRLQRTLGNRATEQIVSRSVQRDWADTRPTAKRGNAAVGDQRTDWNRATAPQTGRSNTTIGETRWASGTRDQAVPPNRTSNVIGDQRRFSANPALQKPPGGIGPVTYEQLRQAEYVKFEAAFLTFVHKYRLNIDKEEPRRIWNELINSIIGGNKHVKNLDKVPATAPDGTPYEDAGRSILAKPDPNDSDKVIREEALEHALKVMTVFVDHAEKYLKRAIDVVLQKGGKPIWCFWSGTGAKEAANANNPNGIVLEGTVGSWFDNLWAFDNVTDDKTYSLHLWAGLSEMYARKAAEYYDRFEFKGYVGPGATMNQNIFNQIEHPTRLQVMQQQYQRRPHEVEWCVTACQKNAQGRWAWDEHNSASGEKGIAEKVPDRTAALARIRDLYK